MNLKVIDIAIYQKRKKVVKTIWYSSIVLFSSFLLISFLHGIHMIKGYPFVIIVLSIIGAMAFLNLQSIKNKACSVKKRRAIWGAGIFMTAFSSLWFEHISMLIMIPFFFLLSSMVKKEEEFKEE